MNAELERRVARRTEELNRSNAALAAEIAEREAAETRARRLRDELAQANRLSILGQVSAGVAHEINQPLAAIRAYAETGGRLLDAGEAGEARGNLREIVGVTERIGAITQTLRGFARRGAGELRPVAVEEAIDGALTLLAGRHPRRRRDDRARRRARRGVAVMAGRIRLEQILVNLLQNALDAVRDAADPTITIAVARRRRDGGGHRRRQRPRRRRRRCATSCSCRSPPPRRPASGSGWSSPATSPASSAARCGSSPATGARRRLHARAAEGGMSGGPVVFVDDDPDLRRATAQVLKLAGFEVRAFDGAEAALAAIDEDFEGPVVTDIRMPRMNGLQLFERVKAIDPELPVLLVTGHGDVELAVAAMKDGAYDFISKPFDGERLATAVAHAAEKRRLVLENRRLRAAAAETPADLPLIGDAPGIRRLRETIRQVADADVDVLVLGETGSGKEVVAQLLHEWSRRRARNFVALNCGALPETVLESELFGHEAGAFTGADRRRVGRIEHASGGTLFLDEIESCPPAIQVKLLRVLETREVEPLGTNERRRLDLRVVAATKVDLGDPAARGGFREDLYYRLNVVTLRIPPLRERRGRHPAPLRALPEARRRPLRPAGARRSPRRCATTSRATTGRATSASSRISPTASRSASRPRTRPRPAGGRAAPARRHAARARRPLRGRADPRRARARTAATCARRSRRSACRARPSTTS